MITDAPSSPALPRERPLALLGRVFYGSYTWLVFVLIALTLLMLLIVVPGVHRRRHMAGVASRLILKLCRVPLLVKGVENLPSGQCVVAANHASYIDAIVIKAVLPEHYAYVVKREMATVPLAGSSNDSIGTKALSMRGAYCGPRRAGNRCCFFRKARSSASRDCSNSTAARSRAPRMPGARWCPA